LQTASHVLKLKPSSNDVQIGPLTDRSVLRSEVTKDRSGCNSDVGQNSVPEFSYTQ